MAKTDAIVTKILHDETSRAILTRRPFLLVQIDRDCCLGLCISVRRAKEKKQHRFQIAKIHASLYNHNFSHFQTVYMYVFPVQLSTSRIGNLTRLIHTLLYVMTMHILYVWMYACTGFVGAGG